MKKLNPLKAIDVTLKVLNTSATVQLEASSWPIVQAASSHKLTVSHSS